ncbi:MAG TPA: hypothetical protein VG738_03850 [Chitinophagaceae bacterium]|nr:hypothetical protein [Chitinophagaceae bacterium]
MKNFFAAFAVLMVVAGRAQTTQETITYNVQVENSPAAALLGDMHMILYYKNGKSLFDMSSPVYSMKTLVTDTGTLMLMNTMGQKFFMKQPVASPDSADSARPDIQYVDETKEIAGYPCKKALVKMPGVDTAVFWYCETLPVVGFGKDAAVLKALKGMPLEYQMNTGQMVMKLTAQKVSTTNIPESTFEISTEGYSPVDDKMLGGMMQK